MDARSTRYQHELHFAGRRLVKIAPYSCPCPIKEGVVQADNLLPVFDDAVAP